MAVDLTLTPNGARYTASVTDLENQVNSEFLHDTAGSVETTNIADGAVTNDKLAGNSVSSGKIQDGAVNDNKLASSSVTTAKVADSAVTNAKMANMTEATIKGRAAGSGTGAPVDLTATQVKTAIGLGNVDNTSDANKTVSTAQQAALDLKKSLTGEDVTVLTSVASADGVAYTASGPSYCDNVGKFFIFIPNTNNTGNSATLAINGGTARSITRPSGSAVQLGRLKAGMPYLVYRESGAYRILFADEGIPSVTSAGTVPAYTGSLPEQGLMTNRRLISFVPHATNVGVCTLALDGGTAYQIRNMDDGVLSDNFFVVNRPYLMLFTGTRWVVIGARRVDRDPAKEAQYTGYAEAFNNGNVPLEVGSFHTQIDLTTGKETYWTASRPDLNKLIYCTGTRWIDFRHMAAGDPRPYSVYVAAGATVKVFNSTTTYTLPANTIVNIYKVSDTVLILSPLSGTVTSGALSSNLPPACDLTLVTAGQSLGVQFASYGGMHGFQKGLRDFAPAIKNVHLIQGATGNTFVLKKTAVAAGGGSATNWWWDSATSTPGPMATDWLAAVSAKLTGQPAPGAIFFVNGQNDTGYIGTANLSIAEFVSGMLALIAWMRAQLSNSTLPVILSVLGASDTVVSGTPQNPAAIRWAQLEVIRTGTHITLGPNYYDLKRPPADVHITEEGQILFGYRLASIVSNLLYSTTHSQGPRAVSMTEPTSGTHFRVRIENDDATYKFFTTFPDVPNIAVIPAGQDPITGTPLEIEYMYWETSSAINYLNIVTRTSSPGATVMFPYGWGWESRSGRVPRNVDASPPLTGWTNHLTLRPFKMTA